MMIRRGATVDSGRPGIALPAADPRLPEAASAVAIAVAPADLRPRLDALVEDQFTGYLALDHTAGQPAGPLGLVLFDAGRPVHASATSPASDYNNVGEAALEQLFAPAPAGPGSVAGPDGATVRWATHPFNSTVVLALTSLLHPPQLTQPMGSDLGEVALLLRDLAAVKHSGVVQISAARSLTGVGPAPWVHILMHEGTFLGVYSAANRQLQASLADVNDVLAAPAPQLTLYLARGVPAPLPLPTVAAAPSTLSPVTPGATPERDELLEADLVWFLSRFERVFGRLKERRDAQADILRAFGELTNELGGFVATLGHSGEPSPAEVHGVVSLELERVRAAGLLGVDLKLGKGGLDPGALGKAYGAQPKHSYAAAEYFQAATTGLLAVIERLLERMLAGFYDASLARDARESCESLLREVRAGLAQTPAGAI